MSDYVLFWIPREVESIPGRDYAQTTRIELMECLAKGKNVILGIDEKINARRYMVYKAGVYGINKICKSLEECIEELKRTITSGGIFFTSDTHFGSDRARQLSRRPFNNVRDMDNTMIRQWNKIVRPDSVVYHLGDFGDREVLKYLGGKITLLLGNYENTEMTNSGKPFEEFREELLDLGFYDVIDYREVVQYDLSGTTLYMNHEPLFLKKTDISKNKSAYGLFGHIHGRQKVKEWGN
jgi:calcineurin-like phosphoesterase family protein